MSKNWVDPYFTMEKQDIIDNILKNTNSGSPILDNIEKLLNANVNDYDTSQWLDPIIGMGKETFVKNLKENKNAGSPAIKEILIDYNKAPVSDLKQKIVENEISQAKQESEKEQPQLQQQVQSQPEDELKTLKNEFIKQNLQKLMKPTQEYAPTNAGDIVSAFKSGGLSNGLKTFSDFIGTSQGQNVMSGLLSMFGKQGMATAYARRANELLPIEEKKRQESVDLEKARQNDASSLLRSIMIGQSPRGGASFKDSIDIYYAQGMISDKDYEALKATQSYINDDLFPSTTINKMLEPYLINKRQTGAVNLERVKQGNRKEIQTIKTKDELEKIAAQHGYRLQEIDREGQVRTAGQKEVKTFEEKLPSTQASTAKNVAQTVLTQAQTQKTQQEVAHGGKLSAETEKALNNAASGLDSVNKVKEIWNKKGKNILVNMLDPDYKVFHQALRDAGDVQTRLRTGAALNKEEQKFYMSEQLPNIVDFAINPEGAIKALDKFSTNYQRTLNNLDPNGVYRKRMGFSNSQPQIGQKSTSKSGRPIIYTKNGWVYEK